MPKVSRSQGKMFDVLFSEHTHSATDADDETWTFRPRGFWVSAARRVAATVALAFDERFHLLLLSLELACSLKMLLTSGE